MTRAKMHEKRIAKWTQLVQEAQDSGLTIKGWCKEHGIQENTFYYWKRQLKSQNSEGLKAPVPLSDRHPAPHFAELNIEKEISAFDRANDRNGISQPEFLIPFRDCQIAVSRNFQEEDLRKIFRVAEHV